MPDQVVLVQALKEPAVYGPWCRCVEMIETHISYVFLTGRYACKIKKAVSLGFLDSTTLSARQCYDATAPLEQSTNRESWQPLLDLLLGG